MGYPGIVIRQHILAAYLAPLEPLLPGSTCSLDLVGVQGLEREGESTVTALVIL